MTNTPPDDADEPQLPPRLAQALRSLPPVVVPLEMDAAILAAARRELHGRQMVRPIFRRLSPRLAAAAAFLVCFLGFWLLRQSSPALVREDLDHNGKVDILDAFALARRLEQGPLPDLQFDLNGDGRVDQRDVEAVTALAVQLHSKI